MVSADPGIGKSRRAALFAWCLYDWADTPFNTVVVTFVFSVYYIRAVAPSVIVGTERWSDMLALSGLTLGLASPILGAIADQSGRRKSWLAVFMAIAIGAMIGLYWVRPDPAWSTMALGLAAVASIAMGLGVVFHNAMLPAISPPHLIGRLSGWAWSAGYFAGLICLLIALFGLIKPVPPPFGLDASAKEPVRATVFLVAGWFLLFGLPLFRYVPDVPASGIGMAQAIRRGLVALIETGREARRYRDLIGFLIASALYLDGITTLLQFGGIFAAGSFGMSQTEILSFAIALNVTAGLGAAGFAFLDDRIGPKPTIVAALVGLVVFGFALLLAHRKIWFWILALAVGAFVGPAQAASRSMMARLVPPERASQMFGFYSFTGKATTFLGPLCLAQATRAFQSQRAGMAVILVLLVAGLILVLRVRNPLPVLAA